MDNIFLPACLVFGGLWEGERKGHISISSCVDQHIGAHDLGVGVSPVVVALHEGGKRSFTFDHFDHLLGAVIVTVPSDPRTEQWIVEQQLAASWWAPCAGFCEEWQGYTPQCNAEVFNRQRHFHRFPVRGQAAVSGVVQQ
jgi:hypothetical protein